MPDNSSVKRPELPPAKGIEGDKEHADKLKAWFKYGIRYEHEYERRRRARCEKANFFDQDIQWLVKSYNSGMQHTSHWSPLEYGEDEDLIPTPVFNFFSGHIENESARMGKPEYKGYIRPEGEKPDPKTREGARIANNALRQIQEEMQWDVTRDRGMLHMPLYGGWFLKSYFDFSYEETVQLGTPDGVQCPKCGMILSSPILPEDAALDLLTTRPDVVIREEVEKQGKTVIQHRMSVCLECQEPGEQLEDGTFGPGSPVPLQPFMPIGEELQRKDHFGRPMVKAVPKGRAMLETVSPLDLFVANLGIGVQADHIDEWWQATVRDLEWIRNRWDNGWQVQPERGEALRKYHPIVGERALYYDTSQPSGASLFDNHARLLEYHHKPFREVVKGPDGKPTGELRMNKGRSVYMANDVVLFDGDYLIESQNHPGTFIPRVEMDYAPWKLRSGGEELDGVSVSEGLFDAQEYVNETISQIMDCQQTMGSPKWKATRGMDLSYEGGAEAGGVWLYGIDPLSPNKEPETVGNEMMNPEVWTALDFVKAFMADRGKSNDAEKGIPIPNISAALAYQFLAEQSGEQRRPRILRTRRMLERRFSHVMLLCGELVREPRLAWVEDDVGTFHQESWKGLDFAGQTLVRIDAEPDHDSNLMEQQAIRDATDKMPSLMEDPRKARIVANKMGLPKDIFEVENLQNTAAQREFSDFKSGTEPGVDTGKDDDTEHAWQHGVDMMSEWFRDREAEAGWNAARWAIWGWEDEFYAPGGINEQLPPDPKALELRIMAGWQMMLANAGHQPATPEEGGVLSRVLRFRAHKEAHRFRAEGIKAAAAQGQPVLAPPGGEETEAGTVPTLGQPEAPAGPPQM